MLSFAQCQSEPAAPVWSITGTTGIVKVPDAKTTGKSTVAQFFGIGAGRVWPVVPHHFYFGPSAELQNHATPGTQVGNTFIHGTNTLFAPITGMFVCLAGEGNTRAVVTVAPGVDAIAGRFYFSAGAGITVGHLQATVSVEHFTTMGNGAAFRISYVNR